VFTASELGCTLPYQGAVDSSSTASPGKKEMLEAVMFRQVRGRIITDNTEGIYFSTSHFGLLPTNIADGVVVGFTLRL